MYLRDPAFNFDDDYQIAYTVFKVIAILILIAIVGLLVHYSVQIIRNYGTRLFRHRIFFIFSVYFLVSCFLFLFTGSLEVYNKNGSRVFLLIVITNIYIYFLMWLYSPTKEGIMQAEQFRDIESRRVKQDYDALEENNIDLNFEMQNLNQNDSFTQ
eukprot:TRINITY_DN12362_c0_g2_i4.p2 TRINITY_DN12362_c0_g2~~TRINITY_DN12362_c0_g2_i4.p2  ORF type:complete len:156 (-),score=45.88 TRINITY_DN12362_c0_g2_i4:361-828(-)